jgi:hypothetical protein
MIVWIRLLEQQCVQVIHDVLFIGDLNIMTLILDSAPCPSPESAVWACNYATFTKYFFADCNIDY